MEHNITAFIYDKRGRVLSVGKNSYVKTHPYQAKLAKETGMPYKIYLHAEIDAIIKCPDLKKAHSIFVVRVGAKGTHLLAKPCPVCMAAISAANIEKIKFTTGDNYEK